MLVTILFPLLLIGQSDSAIAKNMRAGWAIHLGAGNLYGGNIGILGEYQFMLSEKWRVSPCASFGFAEGGTDTTDTRYFWFGWNAGVNVEFGKTHRLFFGPHYVGNSALGDSYELKKRTLNSASFLIGYKGTAKFGLIWQVYIGDIYMQDPLADSKTYDHYSHVGLGIGYKF